MNRLHIHDRGWIEFVRYTRDSILEGVERSFPTLRRAERDRLVTEILGLNPKMPDLEAWKNEVKPMPRPTWSDDILKEIYGDDWEEFKRVNNL